jgi:hypothetical protein
VVGILAVFILHGSRSRFARDASVNVGRQQMAAPDEGQKPAAGF